MSADIVDLTAARRRRVALERGDHVELADRLRAELTRAGELVHTEGDLHRYDAAHGVWSMVSASAQSVAVQAYAGTMVGEKPKPLKLRASDIGGTLSLMHDRVASPGFFNNAKPGLVFANGFVEVTADGTRVHPHAASHGARFRYPFAYEGTTAAPRWLAFLDALFRDDDDRDEKAAFLQEFTGACLFGLAPMFQRCAVAVGEGENGKSKFGQIIEAAMPPGSCVAIPPQDWGNEYRRAMLAGRRFNMVTELPESEIMASEPFKAVVSGELIVGRQIREAPFQFRPVAGHYFAANRLPGTRDMSEGFWRRLVVVRFRRSFKDDPARNPRIAEEICASEMPGLVSWMVQGAVRLLRERAYTFPASHAREVEGWRRNADPVALFIDEMTRPLAEGELGMQARDLYAAYRKWAALSGHHSMAMNKFGERMGLLGKPAKKREDCNRYPVRLEDSGGLLEDFRGSAPAKNGGW